MLEILVQVLMHPYAPALLPGMLALIALVPVSLVVVWQFARIPSSVQSLLELLYDALLCLLLGCIGSKRYAAALVPIVLGSMFYVLLLGIVTTMPGAGVVTLTGNGIGAEHAMPLLSPDVSFLLAIAGTAIAATIAIVVLSLKLVGIRASVQSVLSVQSYRVARTLTLSSYHALRRVVLARYREAPTRTLLGAAMLAVPVALSSVCPWCAPMYPLVLAGMAALVLYCVLVVLAVLVGYAGV